jgi:HrpA-like RNA helicase
MINDAYHLLYELGAIDSGRQPLPLGRQLAGWPLDVRLARMLIEGSAKACLNELIVLTTAQSIQDPRERPADATAAADAAHGRFADGNSDFMAFWRLWEYLKKQRKELSSSQFRKLCRREFLNWTRVNEWFDLNRQLYQQAREEKLAFSKEPGSHEQIHQALLSGLLSHVGRKKPGRYKLHGPALQDLPDFPRLRSVRQKAAMADGRRNRRDQQNLCPHQRRHQTGMDRGAGRAPVEAPLLRAALVTQAGPGAGLGAGLAVRTGDRRETPGELRPDQPAAGA